MPTAKKSVLNPMLNGQFLTLLAALLFTASITSHADNSSATNDVMGTKNQEAPMQEKPATEATGAITPEETIQGKVARAIFTSEIIDREPADNLTEISNSTDRIFFFTDLRNLTGQIITHRWEYNDKVMAEVKFKVGAGPRWRVYSSKNLLPEWTGAWTVTVSDENEQTLDASVFNYTQAEQTVETPAVQEQQTAE